MDGVVSPSTAGKVGKLGGLAVLNLEGMLTRYEERRAARAHRRLRQGAATEEMQRIYAEPVKGELVAQRIREIKEWASSVPRR